MITLLKNYLGKIGLTTKLLAVSLFFLLFLAIGYPFLIKTLGIKLFLNNYVYGLGVKIIDETLLLSYITLGVIIIALLLYKDTVLNKIFFEVGRLSHYLKENHELVLQKLGQNKNNSHKVRESLNNNNKIIDHYHLQLLDHLENVNQQFFQLKKVEEKLVEEIEKNENYCKKVTELFDLFEKSFESQINVFNNQQPMNQSIDQLSDNLFKLQMLAFNINIESLKNNHHDQQISSTPVPSLIKEFEEVLSQSHPILKLLQVNLDQTFLVLQEQNSEKMNQVVDMARGVTKVLFHIHQLHSLADQFREALPFNKLAEKKGDFEKLLENYQSASKSIEQITYDWDKLNKEIALLIPEKIDDKIFISSQDKEKNRDRTNSTLQSTKPTFASILFSPAKSPAINLPSFLKEERVNSNSQTEVFSEKVNKLPNISTPISASTSTSAADIKSEIIKQNILSLYSVDHQTLKTSFFS